MLVSRPIDIRAQSRPAVNSTAESSTEGNIGPIGKDSNSTGPQSAKEASPSEDPVISTKQAKKLTSHETGSDTSSDVSKTNPKKAKKKAPRGALVPAPLPISSPAIGEGIVPALGYIFPFSTTASIISKISCRRWSKIFDCSLR